MRGNDQKVERTRPADGRRTKTSTSFDRSYDFFRDPLNKKIIIDPWHFVLFFVRIFFNFSNQSRDSKRSFERSVRSPSSICDFWKGNPSQRFPPLYGRDMRYRRTTIFHASRLIVNTRYLRMQHIDIVCNVYRARKFAAANVLRFVALRRAISCNLVVLLKVTLPSRNISTISILKNDLKSYQSIKSRIMPKN